MIFDSIDKLPRYAVPCAEKILKFIKENDCSKLQPGQIDIDGQNLFVKVMEYEPKPATENRFETHQVNADLQYVVSGIELMQVAPASSLTSITEYDKIGDYQFYTAQNDISEFVVREGQFVVFYPGQAHKTACLYQNNKNRVKKIVFKIRMK